MKKPLLFFVAILFISIMLICGACDPKSEESGLLIVTTTYAPYDFVREIISGKDARIKMLLKPGNESHTYEPTPQDIISMEKCDLFIYTGGENDQWVTKMLSSLKNKDINKVVLSEIEGISEHQDEEEGHEDHPHGHSEDPHLWTSLRNSRLIVSSIAQKLAEIDTACSQTYLNNAQQYNKKLEELDDKFWEMIDASYRNTIIVADRFPLKHFVEDYGLNYYAAFDGCAAESEVPAATVTMLTNKVKELGIPVVFIIELSNGNLARTVTEGTNAKIKIFYTCHNVTAADFQRGLSYYDMMTSNYHSLREALN